MTRQQLTQHKKNIVMLVALISFKHRGITPTEKDLELETSIQTDRYKTCIHYIEMTMRTVPASECRVLEHLIKEIRSLERTGKCLMDKERIIK